MKKNTFTTLNLKIALQRDVLVVRDRTGNKILKLAAATRDGMFYEPIAVCHLISRKVLQRLNVYSLRRYSIR